jgi:hypothetical protein
MKKYLIIPATEVSKVDFDQVLETSADTVRYSVDGSKTFIKWNTTEDPDFISGLENTEGPYNHEEILEILSDEEWIAPFEEPMEGNE